MRSDCCWIMSANVGVEGIDICSFQCVQVCMCAYLCKWKCVQVYACMCMSSVRVQCELFPPDGYSMPLTYTAYVLYVCRSVPSLTPTTSLAGKSP